LTTSATHGFAVGDIAVITGVDATFNGTYYVKAVPTTTTFTFDKTNANVTSAAASGSVSVSGQRRYAAVARDASDGVIKFFKDITTKPTSTINFSEANAGFAAVQLGALTAASATIGDVSNTELQYVNGVTSAIQTQLDAKLASATASTTYAPLANPTLTGVPEAPTAAPDTNTTQIATTAYVVGQGYLKSVPTAAQLVRPNLTTATETVTVSATAATGTVQVDLVTSAVKYYTSNATADWTFNFRGDGSTTLNSLLANGQSVTVAFLVTNGSTAYKPTVFQVDGSAVTPKWQNGSAPSAGSASSIDVYTFTIIKTASATFTVLGAQTKFA
jgi:ribosomal protein S11